MTPGPRGARRWIAGLDPSAQSIGVPMALVGLAFLLAGIAWPQAADTLLRALLATLATGLFAALAYHAVQPSRTTHELHSPFDPHSAAWAPTSLPPGLRRLTAELSAADDAESARRTAVPPSVRLAVREEAARRLAEHHGLRLDDAAHHPRIRLLVSEPTWLLLLPPGPGARPAVQDPPVPLSRLGLILDDLERL